MADVEKNYLDLQGLQTYDTLIKNYARQAIGGFPEYDSEHEKIIFHAGTAGPSVSGNTLVFQS